VANSGSAPRGCCRCRRQLRVSLTSLRSAPPGLADAVHREVAAALRADKSIVTGGALGVDYWATETTLSIDPARLKVILPTSLATYAAHYRRRAIEGVISAEQTGGLIRQLEAVRQAGGLVEHPERPQVVDVTTYCLRNQDVVDVSDELLAFQVNASGSTQDTVDRPAERDSSRSVHVPGTRVSDCLPQTRHCTHAEDHASHGRSLLTNLLTTATEAWRQPWTPNSANELYGLARRTVMDSHGAGRFMLTYIARLQYLKSLAHSDAVISVSRSLHRSAARTLVIWRSLVDT
jgi:hypothetical protein